MNKTKLTLAAAALCATTAAALPQTGQGHDSQGKQPSKAYGESSKSYDARGSHAYCTLDKLTGAKVRFGSPAASSAQHDKEMSKDSERGEGEVADVLIGTEDGRMRWAVLSCGGMLGMGEKHVAVPFDALRWTGGEEDGWFELHATEEQLEGQPEFDLEKAREQGLDRVLATATTSWKAAGYARDASGERPGTQPVPATAGKQVAMTPASFVAGSELDDLDVRTADSNDDFGGVSRTIVKPDSGCVEFVVVKHGGTLGIGGDEILVPFRAVKVRELLEDDDEPRVVLALNKPKAQLERAVPYEEPDEGVLDEATAQRSREFFGVKDERSGQKAMDEGHEGHDHDHDHDG